MSDHAPNPSAADWRDAYPSFKHRLRTLPELLRWRAGAESGERLAFVAADGRLTFAAWEQRAAAAARRLVELGVGNGEPVGLRAGNGDGCAWVTALIGIQWAGGVPVPISDRTPVGAAQATVNRLGRYVPPGDGGRGGSLIVRQVPGLETDVGGSEGRARTPGSLQALGSGRVPPHVRDVRASQGGPVQS